MRVLVLAGGQGSRLRKVVQDRPKPMAAIENTPFLVYLLRSLRGRGATSFVFLVSYLSEKIIEYFQASPEWSDVVSFVVENQPLGTGGAILNAITELELQAPFVVVNGDTYLELNLKSFYEFHLYRRADVTVAATYVAAPARFGRLSHRDFCVDAFSEKDNKSIPGLINSGAYVIEPARFVREARARINFSLEIDLLPAICSSNSLFCFPHSGRFLDIGIEEDYERAKTCLPQWIIQKKKRALFLDRDGVLIEDVRYIRHKEDVKICENILPILKRAIQHGFLLIVVSNQAGVVKGVIAPEEFDAVHEEVKRQFKTAGIEFSDWYYCFADPKLSSSWETEAFDRKPSPGMLLRAAEKHNLSIRDSLMLGDKDSDVIELPELTSFILKGQYEVKKTELLRTHNQIMSYLS